MNTTVDNATETVTTVGTTVGGVVSVITGGDSNTGDDSASSDTGGDTGSGEDDDGLIEDIVDTVLDLPCLLLSC